MRSRRTAKLRRGGNNTDDMKRQKQPQTKRPKPLPGAFCSAASVAQTRVVTFMGAGSALEHPERIRNRRDYLTAKTKALRKQALESLTKPPND